MKRKCIFFDNDGILVDTEHLVADAAQVVCNQIGYFGDGVSLYREYNMAQGISFLEPLQDQFGFDDAQKMQYKRQWTETYFALVRSGDNLAIPGVENILRRLHGQIPLAIVTAARKVGEFSLIHDRTGFPKYFDFIVTREDYERSKPFPDGYILAFQKAQQIIPDLQKEDCLVFEDSARGVRAAYEAGLPVCAIPTDFTKAMDFSVADYRFETLGEAVDTLVLEK